MQDLFAKLKDKSIHVVGATGAEGSSILRFLIKHRLGKITIHDFTSDDKLEKSFKLWHKGLSITDRQKAFTIFKSDLAFVRQNFGLSYLENIDEAEIIFVPQSWRLYQTDNAPLLNLSKKVPFYSLTRLYLDFAPAKIVAVTGTVGKGSTANIIYQLLKKSLPAAKAVYFAGNETWMPQLADKLDEMGRADILVLEISHRQLQDGFSRAPSVVLYTNIYPNHLDELSWEEYVDLKLSLIKRQKSSDIAILNYDIPQLRSIGELQSKVFYFSVAKSEMNTKSVQKLYNKILNIKSDHYQANLLAGMTAIETLGIDTQKAVTFLSQLKPLPARLELLRIIKERSIYNDIKSTTPWATLVALEKLGKDTVLICGGKAKGIDYKDFADQLKRLVKYVIVMKSEMGNKLIKSLPAGFYLEVDNLSEALKSAYRQSRKNDNILISPAAGFFYSDFIKGKESLRKLITSLPPKEQV